MQGVANPIVPNVSDLVANAAATLGFEAGYEAEQLTCFVHALQAASRFVDVGANRGLYSYVANLALSNSHIALVEANPDLAERLVVEITQWPNGNRNQLEIFHVAAGSESTTLPFFLGKLDTVGTLVPRTTTASGESIEIKCEPLDKLLEPSDRSVFKIDVEGFEYRVLLGAKNLLARDCRVFVELHGWGDPELARYPFHVLWLMARWGFAVSRVGASYTYDFQKAPPYQRWASFLRWAPLLAVKYLIRRSGLRPFFYRAFGSVLGKEK